jgi:hypothetical protein
MKKSITLCILGVIVFLFTQNLNFVGDGLIAIEAVKQVSSDSTEILEATAKKNFYSFLQQILNFVPVVLIGAGIITLVNEKLKQKTKNEEV